MKDDSFKGIKYGGRHWPSHTDKIFNPMEFEGTVNKCIKALKQIWKDEGQFQAIAGSGNSALPILGAISYITNIPMIAVRKKGDSAHDDRQVNGPIYEGAAKSLRYVFVDDFIASGATFHRTVEYIKFEAKIETKCIAMVNYQEDYHDVQMKKTKITCMDVIRDPEAYSKNLSFRFNGNHMELPVYFAQKF